MDLDSAADELYAATPDEFVARRGDAAREARSAGERGLAAEIAGLRKPTVSAWLVNMLTRHRRKQLDELLDLGESLREAQAALAGDALRELSVQRNRVVAALAHDARGLAAELGHPVSDAVEEEVRQTLDAALADPDAAASVRAGRLSKPLTYAGFGSGTAQVATPSTAHRGKPKLEPVTKVDPAAAAKQAYDDAQQFAREATARREQAGRELMQTQRAAQRARERVAELNDQLLAAQHAETTAGKELREAQRELATAEKTESAAVQRLAKAKEKLEGHK